MKRVPDEIGYRGAATCKACQLERNRAGARLRYYERVGVPDGYRLCRWCGLPKQVGVDMTPLGRTCKPCRRDRSIKGARVSRRDRIDRMSKEERAVMRAKQAAKARRQRSTPEGRARHNRQQKEWRLRHPEAAAAAQKRYRKNMMADPEKAAAWRDYQRIYHHDWRIRKGIVPHPLSEEQYRNGNGAAAIKGRLPAQPLRDLISEWLGEYNGRLIGGAAFGTNDGRVMAASYRQLEELSGVSARTIREIHLGQRATAYWATADAVCAALDTPLGSIYT